MASSFQSAGLFNSGPHRFSVGPEGAYLVRRAVLNPLDAGAIASGVLDLIITVRGRLIASDEAGLWQARDAINAALTDPPQVGTLIDHHGREWDDMTFATFTAADRTDRGRTVSLDYEATFIRIK